MIQLGPVRQLVQLGSSTLQKYSKSLPFEVWILVFIEELGVFGLFGAREIALVHEAILLTWVASKNCSYRENKTATRARENGNRKRMFAKSRIET